MLHFIWFDFISFLVFFAKFYLNFGPCRLIWVVASRIQALFGWSRYISKPSSAWQRGFLLPQRRFLALERLGMEHGWAGNAIYRSSEQINLKLNQILAGIRKNQGYAPVGMLHFLTKFHYKADPCIEYFIFILLETLMLISN